MSRFNFENITLQDKADITSVNDNFRKIEALALTSESIPVPVLPDATLTQRGIVQLEDSVTSTSTDTAAVPNSVRVAYELAKEAMESGGVKDHSELTGLGFMESKHTGFAPLSSPAFTDTPTAPTAPLGTNSKQLATTEFTINEIRNRTNNRMQVFTSSGTFIAPKAGYVKAKVQAAGGFYTYSAGTVNVILGAGGYAESSVALTAGQSVAVTVGAPGNDSSFGSFVTAYNGGSVPPVPANPNAGSGIGQLVIPGATATSISMAGSGLPISNIVYTPASFMGYGALSVIPPSLSSVITIASNKGYGYGAVVAGQATTAGTVSGGPGIVIVEWVE